MNIERPDYFEKIEARTHPDNYEQQLVPEAIHFITGIFRHHPDIRIHLARRDAKICSQLHNAEDLNTFKEALEGVFGGDVIHVLATAEEDLMKAVGPVMVGQDSVNLAEVYSDQPEMVLHVRDIVTTARKLIGGLKDELLPIDREPVLVAVPAHY